MSIRFDILMLVARKQEAYDLAHAFVADDPDKLELFRTAMGETPVPEGSVSPIVDKVTLAVTAASADFAIIS